MESSNYRFGNSTAARWEVTILTGSNSTRMLNGWKQQAKRLKSEVVALYFAYKDPTIPWYSKLFIALVVGYALSPVDLIPDFIPILGYLDDLLLIPLGVAIAIKMIPPSIMDAARRKAHSLETKPRNRLVAVIIVTIWVIVLAWVLLLVWKRFER